MSILGEKNSMQGAPGVYKCGVCGKQVTKQSYFIQRMFANCNNNNCPKDKGGI